MISSIHFSGKTHDNLIDLIQHKMETTGKKKISASSIVCQLIDKEHATVKPKRYEKGEETGSDNGLQKQSGEASGQESGQQLGQQNDVQGSEVQ